MKVLHITASDRIGGAALAVWRLHQGLRKHNIDSQLLVRNKYSTDDSVTAINSENLNGATQEFCHDIIQRVYYHNRSEISNTHFSLPLEGIDLSHHPLVSEADVIHLHWVASFQTPKTIQALLKINKPILWTLHDLEPFTGGCHFPARCDQYKTACDACPQFLSDPFDIPNLVMHTKQSLWSGHAFTLIAPSQWMLERAKESAVFHSMPISVIPNAMDVNLFPVSSQAVARSALGISEASQYILCGADQSKEKRKGIAVLSRVLKACFESPALHNAKILWVGDEPPESSFVGLPFVSLGRLRKEEQMANAYAAADIFVLPSLEDNLPNMVLEALSCGTPVIAFDVGGVSEIITNDQEGYLSAPEDEQAMTKNIIALLSSPTKRHAMSAHCRSLIEKKFNHNFIAEQHVRLYESVLEKSKLPEAVNHVIPESKYEYALEQLLPKLTLHCLTNEIKNLQAERSAHLADIQLLQADQRTRYVDIQHLQRQNHILLEKQKSRMRYWIKKGAKYFLEKYL